MDVIMMTTAMRRCLSHSLCSQPNPRNHHDNLPILFFFFFFFFFLQQINDQKRLQLHPLPLPSLLPRAHFEMPTRNR
jgi:hypothetical protein